MSFSTAFPDTTEGTVLIVDDIPTNLEVLLDVLTDSGFEVLVALDGESAIEQVEYAHPDIILLDVMMPGINGFETCRRLKQSPITREIPVIFMTALSDTVDKVKGFELGAVDYITKPLQHEEVLARINTHLTLQHLRRELQATNLELERANTELEQRVAQRTKQLVELNTAYERFVPREFLSFLHKESITDVQLGDQIQKDMSILFSDIRSFTTLSESLTPQENFNFLNGYLGRVSPVIRYHRGFIDKYLGDGIMALFPGDADDAVQAAIDMQREVVIYNRHRANVNYAPIRIGAGIHTGTLMLGIIGEKMRMQGTVISDAVNLAARLDGVCRIFGLRVVVSAQTLNTLKNPQKYPHRFVAKVQVKGKQEVVDVYEIIDGEAEAMKHLKLRSQRDFERGLTLYYARRFVEARQKFERVLARNPDDKAAQLYFQRTTDFITHGVPPKWDGVEMLNEK